MIQHTEWPWPGWLRTFINIFQQLHDEFSCLLTWVWPGRSRVVASWSRGPPGPASPRCWCWRRSEACWPASCSPLQSLGVCTRFPSLSAASPPPSAASWTPSSVCRSPRPPGPSGGSVDMAHSSWTRRPWPCSSSQPPAEGEVITGGQHTDMASDVCSGNWFHIQSGLFKVMCDWRIKGACILPAD